MRYFIKLSHLKIENANAMSSPITIGFPAMTAWLGAVHFIERQLRACYKDISLKNLGISCHNLDLQTYKGDGDFIQFIAGTCNPLEQDGSRPSFIPAPRCHLDVSLIIEFNNIDIDSNTLIEKVKNIIYAMKIASGDVISLRDCNILLFDEDEDEDKSIKPIITALMPGNVLVDRSDLLKNAMNEVNKDSFDALGVILDYIKITSKSTECQESGNVIWSSQRKESGWIVPISIGFHGISNLGPAQEQRDQSVAHRFAESVITLGQFIMPYHIKHIDQILWTYDTDLTSNLYLCKNEFIK
ncbi:MAG: type I-F CRISPR-associated protein Csy2 [Gammaproteobacteria bacterium]|nr:type I-F CRISPR-associated protein Csy2 [Gammaproteobacteria bacterium]